MSKKVINTNPSYSPIQVLSYNSLVVARQNVPITSILTNCTLDSWKDFDVDLSLIASKEITWKTCFASNRNSNLKIELNCVIWSLVKFLMIVYHCVITELILLYLKPTARPPLVDSKDYFGNTE